MNRILVALVLGGSLAGCAAPAGYRSPADRLHDASMAEVQGYAMVVKLELARSTPGEVIEKAKKALAEGLKDPSSAQFRNVKLVRYLDGAVVCGEVNGKNSYGGYVGFKDFVAGTLSGTIRSTGSRYPETDRLANIGLEEACSGREYGAAAGK